MVKLKVTGYSTESPWFMAYQLVLLKLLSHSIIKSNVCNCYGQSSIQSSIIQIQLTFKLIE